MTTLNKLPAEVQMMIISYAIPPTFRHKKIIKDLLPKAPTKYRNNTLFTAYKLYQSCLSKSKNTFEWHNRISEHYISLHKYQMKLIKTLLELYKKHNYKRIKYAYQVVRPSFPIYLQVCNRLSYDKYTNHIIAHLSYRSCRLIDYDYLSMIDKYTNFIWYQRAEL